MYYNFKPDNDETCVSRGICSTSPEIAALQEIMFILLRGLAYYVTKLELSGARNANIKINMIKNIVYLASLQEYTDEQVHQIVNDLFSIFINTEKTYKNFCTRNEIIFDKFNSPIKFENNIKYMPKEIKYIKINSVVWKKISKIIQRFCFVC